MIKAPIFSLRMGKRRFEPKWIPTLAFLIVLPILLNLGLWQLNRADEKRAIVAQNELKLDVPAVELSTALALGNYDQSLITVAGKAVNDATIVVDNQPKDGQLGYAIYGLWRPLGSEEFLLIDRGWLARENFSEKVPTVPRFDTARLEGRIYISKGDNRFVADNAVWEKHDNAWLIGQFDHKTIAEKFKKMGYDTAPFIVRQSADETSGFVREWSLISSPPEKHLAYAIQWFAMAFVLTLLFIFLQLRRVKDHDSTSS